MRRAAAAVCVASVVAGCGSGDRSPSQSGPEAIRSASYVASPTVGPGTAARLFAIPGLGRFTARCNRSGLASVAYRLAAGSASQLVTHRTSGWLDPGDRLVEQVGDPSQWQIAILSEGTIQIATASFSAKRMKGSSFCFVTAKADVSARRR
jgi:hypothetical protein